MSSHGERHQLAGQSIVRGIQRRCIPGGHTGSSGSARSPASARQHFSGNTRNRRKTDPRCRGTPTSSRTRARSLLPSAFDVGACACFAGAPAVSREAMPYEPDIECGAVWVYTGRPLVIDPMSRCPEEVPVAIASVKSTGERTRQAAVSPSVTAEARSRCEMRSGMCSAPSSARRLPSWS